MRRIPVWTAQQLNGVELLRDYNFRNIGEGLTFIKNMPCLDKHDILGMYKINKSKHYKNMKQVTIYSTPSCGYCNMAKEFFAANNIQYTEYNVAADSEKRKEMIEKSGQMGVPVIFIDDEMFIGFDEAKLSKALGI